MSLPTYNRGNTAPNSGVASPSTSYAAINAGAALRTNDWRAVRAAFQLHSETTEVFAFGFCTVEVVAYLLAHVHFATQSIPSRPQMRCTQAPATPSGLSYKLPLVCSVLVRQSDRCQLWVQLALLALACTADLARLHSYGHCTNGQWTWPAERFHTRISIDAVDLPCTLALHATPR